MMGICHSCWNIRRLGYLLLVSFGAVCSQPGRALADENPVCQQVDTLYPSQESESMVRHEISNKTARTFSSPHGNQIEFIAANGTSFLWYPGNSVILPGKWKLVRKAYENRTGSIRCSRLVLHICSQYGENTFNPATGSRGAEWECTPYDFYKKGRRELLPSDPLGLATTSKPPFPLPPDDLSLANIKARMGR